ncbi:MAG: ABC transporter substrate-binding protein, partial [Ruminiclostridium sp.]|nr:ABC transporter substrate-binding protein [Ruminiclostridium sp.]
MGNKKRRILAVILSAAILMTSQPVVYAEEGTTETTTGAETAVSAADNEGEEVSTITNIMSTGDRENTYSAYFTRHSEKNAPKKEIVINASEGEVSEGAEYAIEEYEKVEDCLVWTSNGDTVTYNFTVEETGIYNLEMYYYTIAGKSTTIDIGIMIDGEYPFTACKDITLDRYWEDASEIRKDSKDNELKPTQKEKDKWVTYALKDKEGLFNDPYIFYLEEGTHTLTLEGIRTNLALKNLTFKNYEKLPEYVRPSQVEIEGTPALTNENAIESKTILIQAETPLEKTSSTLYATYDRTSYKTNPSHPTKQRYNTLGSGTWDQATQAVTWNFTIPSDGYYTFAFKARQNTMRGFYSNRRIYIDGVVPNEQMDIVSFPYDPNWYVQNLTTNEGEDMYLYLEAGEHTITMEVVPGSIGEIMRRLDDLVYTLNYYYRRILMITGPDPDEYNDYLVDIQIPELIPTFESAIKTLYEEKANIEKLGQGSEASSLESLAVILERCCEEKDEIPQMVSTLKDYISSVSAWMRDYRDQPLELDYIEVLTVHEEESTAKGNFFESFAFGFRAFVGSFFEDYTMLSDATEKSINTWVSLGRDQATVVKDLVDNDFNQNNSGINISINLVQGGILEATLAGKGPDVALFLGGDVPIKCAARDLLVDVSTFNDYEDVVK